MSPDLKNSIPPQKGKASRIRVRLTDEQFVQRFLELYECRSEMAFELGISYQAVNQRARKLQPLIEKAKAATAVVVARDHSPDVPGGNPGSFVGHYLVFNNIEGLYRDVVESLNTLKAELAEIKQRREAGDNSEASQIRPWHFQELVKLVNAGRCLLMDCHRIRTDLLTARGTLSFINSTVEIFGEEVPDVRERLFTKLMEYGVENDVTTMFSGVK